MARGPNHKPGCDGIGAWYSGSGYNRVLICGCGAEDHAPESGTLGHIVEMSKLVGDNAALRERVAALETAIANVRAAVSQPPDGYEGNGLWWDSRGEAAVEALLAMLPKGGA